MIYTLRAQHYGCLLDVTAKLTPLHAFIGPNDTGKSTLLHAMRTVVQFAGGRFAGNDLGLKPFDPRLPLRHPSEPPPISAPDTFLGCVVEGGWYAILAQPEKLEESVSLRAEDENMTRAPSEVSSRSWKKSSAFFSLVEHKKYRPIMDQLRTARLVRFDPDALRKPSGLIPETESTGFLDDRGLGLPAVYFALRNRDDNVFGAIVDDVRKHFSNIKGLRVKAVSSGTVEIETELQNGALVQAAHMSEGLLYYLAFAALRHLAPTSLLLVEEPENGLHPARIAEVMAILREVSKTTQVILATHSPLVINELQPEEVSVVTRTPEHGTKVTPIKDTPSFDLRSKAYALGELWLSYANGVDEAPLLQGGPRP